MTPEIQEFIEIFAEYDRLRAESSRLKRKAEKASGKSGKKRFRGRKGHMADDKFNRLQTASTNNEIETSKLLIEYQPKIIIYEKTLDAFMEERCPDVVDIRNESLDGVVVINTPLPTDASLSMRRHYLENALLLMQAKTVGIVGARKFSGGSIYPALTEVYYGMPFGLRNGVF